MMGLNDNGFSTRDELEILAEELYESMQIGDTTANDLLQLLKTVDGSGSGLDADRLDGEQGSYYATASSLFTKVDRSDLLDFTFIDAISTTTQGYITFGSANHLTFFVQWGFVSIAGISSDDYTFPTTFPNQVYAVVATPVGGSSGGGQSDYFGVYNFSQTGFSARNDYNSAKYISYIAIGF